MIHRETLREPLDTSAEIEDAGARAVPPPDRGPGAARARVYLIDLVVRGVIVVAVGMLAAIGGIAVGQRCAALDGLSCCWSSSRSSGGIMSSSRPSGAAARPASARSRCASSPTAGSRSTSGTACCATCCAPRISSPFIDPLSFLGICAVGLARHGP